MRPVPAAPTVVERMQLGQYRYQLHHRIEWLRAEMDSYNAWLTPRPGPGHPPRVTTEACRRYRACADEIATLRATLDTLDATYTPPRD